MTRFAICQTAIAGWLAFTCPQAQSARTAVEFFHSGFAHYFVTADPAEITALEDGVIPGWSKTGYAFSVTEQASDTNVSVCRFFSTAFAPKSSHFYTPYATECSALRAGTTWTFESMAFYLQLPFADGTCPTGSAPIFRLYNNGMGGAPNHRYTAVREVVARMKAQGWTVEGNSVTQVFACGPTAPSGSTANVTLTSSTNSRPYDISIYVPRGYDPDSAPVPVVYALDAQIRLKYFIDTLRQSDAKVILVQIYDMSARAIDHQMPGAFAFHAFITKDLIPYIDSNYRSDPSKRAISGLSNAANFSFNSLYIDTPGRWHFSHYHLVDGALTQQAEDISTEEQKIYDAIGSSPFPVTLIFAGGATVYGAITKALYDKVAMRHYQGLQLYNFAYPTDHIQTDIPALLDLLAIMCGKANCRGLEH
jgi:hypothetical protein